MIEQPLTWLQILSLVFGILMLAGSGLLFTVLVWSMAGYILEKREFDERYGR